MKYSIILFFLFLHYLLDAQTNCGTNANEKNVDNELEELIENPNIDNLKFSLEDYYIDNDQYYQIPMTCHIIRKSNGQGGTNELQLRTRLTEVNQHFLDVGMQFFIETINFVDDDIVYNTILTQNHPVETKTANLNNVPNTVNVYFYPYTTSNSSWSNFPDWSNDWTIIRNSHLTLNSIFSHELGHYFGLYHTHETGFCEEFANKTNCSSCGDLLCDTEADPNLFNKVTRYQCKYVGPKYDRRGTLYKPDVKNIMSYSPPECSELFTNQQKHKLLSTFHAKRNYLNSKQKLGWYVSFSGLEKWERINFSVEKISNMKVGDFDGDGIDDIFTTVGNTWYYSQNGRGKWQPIQRANEKISQLLLADFTGDGKTDVFTGNGKEWFISNNGKSTWVKINRANETASQLLVGEFTGDSIADVFTTNGREWFISEGGKSPWVKINEATETINQLLVGDFDGDSIDDIFTSNGRNWYVSKGGKEKWIVINQADESLSQLHLGDFTGDGIADVFLATGKKWYISESGRSKWKRINKASEKIDKLLFGNFDINKRLDVFTTVKR